MPKKCTFFAKKMYFFLQKKVLFLQKKVHFFPKKSTFFWQKKVFFLIKKYIFLLDCLLINEFSDVLCNIKGAPKPDLYLQLLSIPKMLLMLPAPGARVDDEANLRWRWTNKELDLQCPQFFRRTKDGRFFSTLPAGKTGSSWTWGSGCGGAASSGETAGGEKDQGGASLSPGSHEPGSLQGGQGLCALNCPNLPHAFFIAKPVQLKI